MPEHQFKPGDRVTCNPNYVDARYHGVVWTIDRLGPVNAFLNHPAGGVGLKIARTLLTPAQNGDTTTDVALLRPLDLGAVVTVTSPAWRGSPDPHVVLKDNGDTVKLVQLGGNGNRYWPKIPRTWITEIDPAKARAAITAIAGETR
ncbi:hypothetical protein [Catenuloplanes japonicus]|uniref:hypothetical protein n=1 Tax=Catenuloplanes japonicus TaxID=33876 RepID=UPI0005256AA5|nr:hypothetical protein [Catenuloplanes japonicus]